jgi:RimJ/RimL family protein N-acetyltransferase
MILLSSDQRSSLKSWFLPDRPGPLIGLHIIHTGNGSFLADRWPQPRVLLVETAGNYSLAGDPQALTPADLNGRINGFLEAPDSFLSLLQKSCPEMKTWERIILALETDPPASPLCAYPLRRVIKMDAKLLARLSPEVAWIIKTWGSPRGLAQSGCAWIALDGDQIVSLACSFFVGESYEDIGIVTEPAYRGRGLGAACAGALCRDITARGRRPSWSTSTDNLPSFRVAQTLGFQFRRNDRLFVVGQAVPVSPRSPRESQP